MAKIFLLVECFILFGLVFAEVPSYIKICPRKSPNLDECLVDTVNSLRDKLRKGIPELDVPSAEPFSLPEGLPLADSPDLHASARNVKLWNGTSFEFKHLHADIENKRIDFEVFFKKLKLQGDYDVEAKIVVPIKGKGPIKIDTDDVTASGSMFFQLVNTKRGLRVYFSSISMKLLIGDYHSTFVPTEGSKDALAEAINSVLNTNRREIIDGILPSLEKSISGKILEIANRICKKFTFDELFPDNE